MPIMSAVTEKQLLIDNVVRLRRAERISPAVDEISSVRADLERRIGRTVSRAMAARALGVSQTAIDGWVERGDIPAVVTPSGRWAIPLGALLELVEDVNERKRRSEDPHPLAAVLHERRRLAGKLDLEVVLPARYRRGKDRHGHREAELRSLAYHRAVASRLDETLVAEAQRRLRRWQAEGRIDERYAERWAHVLEHPLPRIRRLISEDSQRSRDLRQNSPLAGALHERERQRVLELVA